MSISPDGQKYEAISDGIEVAKLGNASPLRRHICSRRIDRNGNPVTGLSGFVNVRNLYILIGQRVGYDPSNARH